MGAVLLFHDGEQSPRPPGTPHPPKHQNGGAEWTHRRREREEKEPLVTFRKCFGRVMEHLGPACKQLERDRDLTDIQGWILQALGSDIDGAATSPLSPTNRLFWKWQSTGAPGHRGLLRQ